MAADSLPTKPVNPYLTYNFLVKWDNKYVAAVTSVSGLTKRTAVVPFRAGGQPQTTYKLPGQTDYAPLRIERGITTDKEFEQWANKTWYLPNTNALGKEVQLDSMRKSIQLELYDQSGVLALRYNIYNCWPSEYTALPELNAQSNAVALASLTLEHEGWDRDPPLPLT